jgi:hypothetical protein
VWMSRRPCAMAAAGKLFTLARQAEVRSALKPGVWPSAVGDKGRREGSSQLREDRPHCRLTPAPNQPERNRQCSQRRQVQPRDQRRRQVETALYTKSAKKGLLHLAALEINVAGGWVSACKHP